MWCRSEVTEFNLVCGLGQMGSKGVACVVNASCCILLHTLYMPREQHTLLGVSSRHRSAGAHPLILLFPCRPTSALLSRG